MQNITNPGTRLWEKRSAAEKTFEIKIFEILGDDFLFSSQYFFELPNSMFWDKNIYWILLEMLSGAQHNV
jgi:hypothetical protein